MEQLSSLAKTIERVVFPDTRCATRALALERAQSSKLEVAAASVVSQNLHVEWQVRGDESLSYWPEVSREQRNPE